MNLNYDRILLFTLFLLLQLPLHSLAQERQQYQGKFKLGKYLGNADFSYKVSGKDTIYDGPFQFQRSSLLALMENEDFSFLFRGNLENGIAYGPWQFQFGDYKSNSQSEIVDFEYRVLISGIQEEGTGAIQNGSPDGNWRYQVNRVKDSELDTVLFKSEFSFEKGVPQKNFKIENDSAVLVGRFLRDGLAHDEWASYSYKSIEDTENWFFNEGLLKRIEIMKDGDKQVFPIFDAQTDNYKIIPLDLSYLELLQAVFRTKGYIGNAQSSVTGLLIQNERYYQKIDSILNRLGSSKFRPKYRAKVPFTDLNPEQRKILENVMIDYDRANAISTKLLNNSHLNIVTRSDEDALYKFRVAAKISERFLQPVAPLVRYYANDIIEYVDLPEVLNIIWANGKPKKEVTITDGLSRPKSFILENAEEFNFDGTDLKAVQQLVSYAKYSLENLAGALADRLTNEEGIQELNDLEKSLISSNDALVQKVDSLKGLPNNYDKALEQIKVLSDSSLQDYAIIKAPKEKLEFGTNLKVCIENLTNLTGTIGTLPEQEKSIDSLYQDAVWNPFMANLMNEEVKKAFGRGLF